MRRRLGKAKSPVELCPDLIRGPTDEQANFSFSEDTYGTRTAKPRGFAGRISASVTQLASLRLSSTTPAASPKGPSGGDSSSRRVSGSLRCRRLSAEAPAFACRRDRPVLLHGETCGFAGGGGDRARTDDPLLAKQALSQLSYTPGPDSRNQISQLRRRPGAPDRGSDI